MSNESKIKRLTRLKCVALKGWRLWGLIVILGFFEDVYGLVA